ncbi:Ribokinase-like protein [Dunaliella salina]|uniref:Ribokinase-like protein n=1 Tax=Dunaliella salina TaxID=3046 RepID=A0ABQ7GAT8_DUNSA|nr:Ribokinase-like protein [Dunaliella salina]|eukprot:KAF5831723.1 Ribokinase-like protein [Dunaliella salina]
MLIRGMGGREMSCSCHHKKQCRFTSHICVMRRKRSNPFTRHASANDQPHVLGQARTRVVAVGEALFDLIADQKGLPRNKVKSWTPFAGGAICNVATAIGRLGMDVVFVTAMGKDERGDQLLELLKKSGVKTHGVQRRDEPTRDVYVVQDSKGDREFAGFGLPSEQYSDCYLDEQLLPLEDTKTSAVLVTGTLALAHPQARNALKRAVQVAREGNSKVFVDVNWRDVFWTDHDEAKRIIIDYLQQADLLKVSDADLKWLLGIDLSTAFINPCLVSEAFPNTSGILVTAGDEGAAYCFRSPSKVEHSGYIPSFKVKVQETTGAGDAFTAGFIYKLIEAGNLDALAADSTKLKEAIVFASAAGALTCTKKGAIDAQPTLDEVMQLFGTSKEWYNFW